MVEVQVGFKTIDLPYTIWVYGATEEMFDELTDEDTKAELIDGVMIVHSPASLRHEHISGFLGGLMSFYADVKGHGMVIASGNGVVHLATCRKLSPDVFFIRQARVPMTLPKEFEGPPDLVVEVLSPSTRREDLGQKRAAYHDAGVGEIWFVDFENKRFVIDRKRGDSYVEEIVSEGVVVSSVLDGFWVNVAWVWTEPLPNRMSCLQEILDRASSR
jgi:Uma2 family endonuclease